MKSSHFSHSFCFPRRNLQHTLRLHSLRRFARALCDCVVHSLHSFIATIFTSLYIRRTVSAGSISIHNSRCCALQKSSFPSKTSLQVSRSANRRTLSFTFFSLESHKQIGISFLVQRIFGNKYHEHTDFQSLRLSREIAVH